MDPQPIWINGQDRPHPIWETTGSGAAKLGVPLVVRGAYLLPGSPTPGVCDWSNTQGVS